jgi:hypothetical protein
MAIHKFSNLKQTAGLFLLATCSSLVLLGCGGGSSSSSSSSGGTISGVAATGAPLENANITITCADGSIKTGTANSSGQFSVDIGTGCPAPYVLEASVEQADGEQKLVSVHSDAVSGSATVNITPLTHAISATLASDGNPFTLAANIASEKTNVTSSAVQQRNQALVASLSGMIGAAGVSGTPNLITTGFSADRTGLDKLLDNIKVTVAPSEVTITNPAGSKVDDMGNVGTASVAENLSSSAITISRATDFSRSIGSLPSSIEAADIVDSVQAALNACFALPASNRISGSTLLGACATLTNNYITADYRHDGKNLAAEWNAMMTSSSYDGATFQKPEIIRYFSSSAADSRALVRFGLMRASGIGEWFVSVAEKSSNTGGTWKLRGNQRNYRLGVSAYITREEQVLTRGSGSTQRPAGAYFHSGLNFYFDADSNVQNTVQYVLVKGPGLPTAGLYLRPLSTCSYLVISTGPNSSPTDCTSLYRMQYRKASASDPENTNTQNSFGGSLPYFAPVARTDSEMQAILPFSAYRFEIVTKSSYNANNSAPPDFVYIDRLRGRPMTLGTNSTIGTSEVDKLVFNTGLSDSIKTLINPDSSAPFAGGRTFTLTWNNVRNAPPVSSVQVQFRPNGTLYQDDSNVRLTASSATFNNSGVGWGGSVLSKTGTNFMLVQLRGRDSNDLQYFQGWRY